MGRRVIIDGVEYVPVTQGTPHAEQIARALMEQFWGELSQCQDWRKEAAELWVHVDECSDGDVSVLDMATKIYSRMNDTQAEG